MCLVDDDHVPGGIPDRRKHVGPLDEIDRRNDQRFSRPRVHPDRQAGARPADAGLVEDGEVEAKALSAFIGPLFPKAGRTEDEHASGGSSGSQFGDDQGCLYRLSEPHIVGNQDPAPASVEHGKRRLELVRQQVDPGVEGASERGGRAVAENRRPTRTPPGAHVDTLGLSGLAGSLDIVEWMENRKALARVSGTSAGQRDQPAAFARLYRRDDPRPAPDPDARSRSDRRIFHPVPLLPSRDLPTLKFEPVGNWPESAKLS
jgi:hypothetical protein